MLNPDRFSRLAFTLLTACAVPDDPIDEPVERHAAPAPGAAGIGDPLYPTLGNGGYDVDHYDLELRYATAQPDQAIDGMVRITAHATQALSQFNLDFAGDSFGSVTVDGCAATAQWDGEELVITPAHPIRRGERFVVEVEHFAATPVVPDPEDFLGAPFFITPDGSAWAGQPNGAHRIFPSNDHPRDLASFSFRIDVPAGTTAVANGELERQHTSHGRTTWKYEQHEPMATELAQVVVGAFTVIDRGRHAGVEVRDVVPTRLAAELDPKLAIVTAHLDWLEERVGNYPFKTYGSLAVDTQLGFALETQTLSLFETQFFGAPEQFYAPIMVHELAHQWFGDSVAPAQWADVWQNEGHATWYELTFQLDPDSPEFVDQARQIYALGDTFRALFGPVAKPLSGDPAALFNPNVYYGGALALFALRLQIGDANFRQLERRWVQKYRGRSASTQDFIALASHVSGQDLDGFLTAWLYGETTPAMPGHPDWTVDPVGSPFARALPRVDMHGFDIRKH
ncbi:MAG: M1 family metallopeptidase [Kofleriaceae bacterium]